MTTASPLGVTDDGGSRSEAVEVADETRAIVPPDSAGDPPAAAIDSPDSDRVDRDARRGAEADTSWPGDLVELYEERWLPLTRLAFLLTGDRAVAEELVQDAFLKVRPGWDRIDQPRAYLRASVVNATRDWGRRAVVAERHRSRTIEHAVDHPDEMWDALGRLDRRRRDALVLRFYEDLPDREIAELLGCRPATVRTLIHRGLRDLRREMTS